MSPTTVEILIRAAITIGVETAVAIARAVSGGDVDTTKQLAAVLPDAERQLLEDEALIQQQRKLAGVPA